MDEIEYLKTEQLYRLVGVGALNKLFCNLVRCFPRSSREGAGRILII